MEYRSRDWHAYIRYLHIVVVIGGQIYTYMVKIPSYCSRDWWSIYAYIRYLHMVNICSRESCGGQYMHTLDTFIL